MLLPEKSKLPLTAREIKFLVDDKKIEEFHRAFRDKLTYVPPTVMAVSMSGIFDLLNSFEIDWRKLLHATQSFTYHESFQPPVELVAQTTLLDLKFRAAHHWLAFETRVRRNNESTVLVTSKSLLMIREGE